MNWYNENDKKAAVWLRELIKEGHLPPGDVDERSIADVKSHEIAHYTQCHFFAGIGGWSLALRLAGWRSDRPVWTGSCPCQPFSTAGKGKGVEDPRHLWPVFRELIRECQPPTVFGEQVASPAGRLWLSGVFADLEEMEYRRAGADLCAAGVGAPHIRQRLYWVADTNMPIGDERPRGREQSVYDEESGAIGLADPDFEHGDRTGFSPSHDRRELQDPNVLRCFNLGGVEHAESIGREQRRTESGGRSLVSGRSTWDTFDILNCTDGKARRIEARTFPLAHGVPHRVGLLRGYGNAIVPEVAVPFIQAYDESN